MELQPKKSTNNHLVFVYGSLKSGRSNHNAYLGASDMLGRGYMEGLYDLIDLGWYPAVLRREDGQPTRIYGEVYEVDEDTFYSLDLLEGHPDYYKREQVNLADGTRVWTYFLPEGYRDSAESVVDNGCWRADDDELAFIEQVA